MCLHATIKLFQQLLPEVWKKAELKANMRPTQKQHNVCWRWDFLPNVFHLQFNLPSSSFLLPMSVFDATMQLNGGGRNPEPYQLADGSQSWSPRFHSFGQVSAQVTRWFRHWSIYVGGENLTGFKQKTPIYGASNPWGSDFEPTLVWGPVEGRMFYAGVRVHF